MKNHHAQVHGESLAVIEVECAWCGETFEDHKSQVEYKREKGQSVYCSRECYDEKQSERRTGMDLADIVGEEGAQKSIRKVRERMTGLDQSGENNPMYGTTRNLSDETKEKISKTSAGRKPPEPEWMFDEEVGHFTRSSWERKFARELVDRGIEYEYEGVEVKMGGEHVYRPDFVFGEQRVIVELKGRDWSGEADLKAECCMNQYPEFEYVVVGADISCDTHYAWENREQLIDEMF